MRKETLTLINAVLLGQKCRRKKKTHLCEQEGKAKCFLRASKQMAENAHVNCLK